MIQQRGFKKLSKALALFQSLSDDRKLPLAMFSTFIIVADNDHVGVFETPMGDIQKALNVAQPTNTRHVARLTDWTDRKDKGLGLCKTEIDPMYSSRKLISLTPKGRTFADKLREVLK